MESRVVNHRLTELSELHSPTQSSIEKTDFDIQQSPTATATFNFQNHFEGCMEMYGNAETVNRYLSAHQNWFRRCAHPMKAEPLGENSYALTIGRFGAFGYEVEPKIGLKLLPQNQGIYRMHTVPVPDYAPSGYEVDYQASIELVEDSAAGKKSSAVTLVEWQLDLGVAIQFPNLIHRLPPSAIQKTGNRLLDRIVRQVSRSLTYKVQEDFHSRLGLPMPPTKSLCS